MSTKPLIIIIDDEVQMRRLLRIALESGGFQISDADTGEGGLSEIVSKKPDAVVLDLGLPDIDGVVVLKRLREWSQIPVLILSVRDDEKQKVAALDAGADDYVTKPFGTEELLARLRAILRRTPENEELPIFENKRLVIDYASRRVLVNEKEIKLTATEYAILKLLSRNCGKVLTHRQILREIWGPASEERTQYLRVYMTHLRQKIESDPNKPQRIKTESGIGYRFCLL